MSKERCLQHKLGSCLGCNVLELVAERARWQRIGLEEAADEVAEEYCPSDAKPQHQKIRNEWASFGMGQPRAESFDFSGTERDLKGKKLHKIVRKNE